jgi:23S rRNA (uracil1939-C5)-methyltransferase
MSRPEEINCLAAGLCSGCSWIEKKIDLQKDLKMRALQEGLATLFPRTTSEFPEIRYERPFEKGFRDRLDFIFENGRRGLYSVSTKKIYDLPSCPLLSPALAELYEDFRKVDFPIQKGSFRLRSGPQGQRGMWLDFSNKDIKFLLEEQLTLKKLLDLGFVEIGQKGKRLVSTESRLKLHAPVFQKWFNSRFQKVPVPLYSLVSHFTQPGHAMNQVLLSLIEDMFQDKAFDLAVEFGSGIGNLTFTFLSFCKNIIALDWSGSALQALRETVAEYPTIKNRIQVREGNFIKQPLLFGEICPDLLILNPARSGVGQFLNHLPENNNKPTHLFYMSCYLESFLKDALVIKQKKYTLKGALIFDQFPHSPHFEILSLWTI